MSWLNELLITYENSIKDPDCDLPHIYHRSRSPHIIATINQNSELINAKVIDDKKFRAQIPTTEKSASRTTGSDPHPLSEAMQYCAMDYVEYAKKQNSGFDDYIKQLSDWYNSSYSNPKLDIIIKYLQKKTLIKDLVQFGIIKLDENDKLLETHDPKNLPELFKRITPSGEKYEQEKSLIVWRIEIPDDLESNTWEDKTLINSWQEYYRTQADKIGMCQITGEKDVPIATSHPKGIRYPGDSAKIISTPSSSSYCTYQGKFDTPDDVCTISREVSEKTMASVLPWLIRRQAFKNKDQVILAWHSGNKKIPQVITDNNSGEFGFLNDETTNDEDESVDTAQAYAIRLNKALAGYQQNIENSEQINILVLDSFSKGKGRISVEYRELTGSNYFERLAKWYSDFAWPFSIKKNKTVIQPPTYNDIIKAAYGDHITPNHKKKIITKIFKCIINNEPFPTDLLKHCMRNISNRASKKNVWEWRELVNITCALYKGYYMRHPNINKRRTYSMSLERELTNRDYLWGRMLAIAYKIEDCALRINGTNRITSAEQLYRKFSQSPSSTWNIIVNKLQPYKMKLKKSEKYAGLLFYWEKELQEIANLFSPDDFKSNKKLSGEQWLAYMTQLKYFATKKEPKPEQSTKDTKND